MAMLKPSQSHSGGVTVKPYTGNIAQELQFLTGEKKKKKKKNTNPIFRLGSPWQPSKKTKPILRLGSPWQPSNYGVLKVGGSHVPLLYT